MEEWFLNAKSMLESSVWYVNKNNQSGDFLLCFQTVIDYIFFFKFYLAFMLYAPFVVLKNKVSDWCILIGVSLWSFPIKEQWHTIISLNIFIECLHIYVWHCSHSGGTIMNCISKNHFLHGVFILWNETDQHKHKNRRKVAPVPQKMGIRFYGISMIWEYWASVVTDLNPDWWY